MKIREIAKERLRPLKGFRALVMVILLIDDVLPLMIPYYMGYLLDHVNDPSLNLTRSISILLLLIVSDFFLNWLQNFLWHKMLHQGAAIMRSAVFEEILRNPWNFFQKYTRGDIVNRVLNDANQYATAYLIQIPVLVLNLIVIVMTMGFIVSLNIYIAGLLTLVCIIYFLSYRRINIKLREHAKLENEQGSALYQATDQYYDTIPTVKLFLQERFFAKKYNEYVEKLNRQAIINQRWKSLALSLANTLVNLMPVLSAITGIILLLNGKCTIGAIFSIYTYAGQFGEPIRNLTDYNITAQQGKVNEGRLNEIICGNDNIESGDKIEAIEDVNIHDLNFSYSESESLFEHFNMNMRMPERIAIRGTSGAGKSTLLKILTGQIEPDDNSLTFNGIREKDINEKSLVSRFAVMTQDVFLFDDTIRNNILFGREIPEDRFKKVTDALGVSSYMNRDITQLSGGEKRRVGLARVLVGDFDLLIMDEPTSDLDEQTERNVITFLDTFLREINAMLLVVTHRPAIIDICDRVIEL